MHRPKANLTLRSLSPLFALLCTGVIVDLFFRSYEMVRMFSLITALILVLASLGERKKPINALLFIIFGNSFGFLSIVSGRPGMLYLIGLLTSALMAFRTLGYINARRTIADLKSHHGLFQQFPLAASVFLIGVLGIVSFPLSSTFYGEDILLELSIESGLHYLILFQLIFIISGISVIRMYSLVMFGIREYFIKDIDLDFTPLSAFLRLALFNTWQYIGLYCGGCLEYTLAHSIVKCVT